LEDAAMQRYSAESGGRLQPGEETLSPARL
jgi:hypothetical protein